LQLIIDKCRICGTEGETIEHIISSCTVLAQSEYKKRHDIFAKIIHMNLAVKFNLLKNTQPHYSYKPESCLENDNYKLYFDRTVLTDIHIKLELSVAMRNLWCGGDFTTYNFSNGNSTYYLRLKYLHNLLAHSVHKFCWNQTLPNQNYLLNKI
jgi:hypothetical protein